MPRFQLLVVRLRTSVRGLSQQLAEVPSWLLSCGSHTFPTLMLVINRILEVLLAGLKGGWLHKRKLKIAPISSGKQKANTDSINHFVWVPNVGSCSPSNKRAIRASTEVSTRTSRC